MNSKHLTTLFFNALSWNAFSYSIYKASYTFLSFVLCAHLSQTDFTIWATLMSFVFFALLLLDCGFRKSVPRYCPEFSYDQALHAQFIRWICCIQAGVMLCALPIFYLILPSLFCIVGTATEHTIFFMGTFLFFSEGFMGLMRLVYHAHFWNKWFNSLSTVIVLVEVVLSLCAIHQFSGSLFLVHTIIGLRSCGSLLIACISLFSMPHVVPLDRKKPPSTRRLVSQFAQHSCFMWVTSLLKSITERNFLVPYIMYTLGPAPCITFKLASDAALFFYRIALKTIGTNDTAFLSHARHVTGFLGCAFTQLMRTMTFIALPLLFIAIVGALCAPYVITTTGLIAPFLIFTCGYMLEVMLLPYERLLEVNREYGALSIAYLPYVIVLFVLWYYQVLSFIGFLPFIVVIQCLRLMSSSIMAYQAKRSVI